MSTEQKHTTKPARIALLWTFLEGYRPVYLMAIAAVAVATVAGYTVPIVMRLSIDSILGARPVDLPAPLARWITDSVGLDFLRANLWVLALVIVAITMVGGIFQFLQRKLSADASERAAERVRERLYDHLQHLSYDYHVKAETGDLIQRCTSDVETIRRFTAIQLVEMGRAVILLFTAYPLLFSLHVPLALMCVPIVVGIFFYSVWFFRKVQKVFQLADESEGRLSTTLQENLT
ncbi:MAG: ABC transporter ATP-binding protein, partial [Spirochaetaceae bacterium]